MNYRDEQFFIAKPVPAGTVEVKFDNETETLPAYKTEDGQILIWADRDGNNPLPEIRQTITVTMNNIGPAEVVGYFCSPGDKEAKQVYLGVMDKPLAPPRWLREQSKRDTRPSDPQWMREGIGCAFATEFEPHKRGDLTKHRAKLKALREQYKDGRY